MKKMLLGAVVCLASLSCLGGPKVAQVYSAWPNGKKGFANEFDIPFKRLGYQVEKFENTKLQELSGRLGDFELVCISTTGNYENTVDLTPYAPAWLKYIEQGGMMMMVDANYPSVLQSMLNTLGPDFALFPENCSAYTKGTEESKKKTFSQHSLFSFPMDLKSLMAEQSNWTHLKVAGKGWNKLTTCVDDHGVLLFKDYGKGMIMICAPGDFRTIADRDTIVAMLTNMKVYTFLRNAGVNVVSSSRPTGIGKSALSITFSGDEAKLSTISITLNTSNKDGQKTLTAKPVIADGIAKIEIPVMRDVRGKNNYAMSIAMNGKELTGSTWSEDLPPVISYKLRRKHLYPANKEISLSCIFSPDKDKEDNLTFRWRFDNGTWDDEEVVDLETAYNFKVAGLPLGKHTLEMTLLHNNKVLSSEKTDFFLHPAPTYEIRKDGVLMENGKSFFPMGFYHVSWSQPPEHRLAMARAVAGMGYNTVHVGILNAKKEKDYGEFLDECAKIGIRVITEFGQKPEDVITKYRDHKAVMGWNPGDEPAAAGISAAQMFSRYDKFKQLDSNHIAYTVICIPAQYKNYASGTDVLAPDPYPIPKGKVDSVYYNFKNAYSEALKYDTTVWAVPQCFGNYGSWSRPPTAKEFRAMTYLALLAGVKGLVYYTYYDGGFNLPNSPELHQACKDLPGEIKDLIPMILDGQFTMHQETKGGIYAGSWNMNAKRITVVINASDKDMPFDIKIDGKLNNPKPFAGTPLDFNANNNGITGKLAPLERILVLSEM